MTQNEFADLRYGNVMQNDATGELFIVKQVVRTPKSEGNKAKVVGLMPAVNAAQVEKFTVVSKDRCVAYISGDTINE